MTPSIWTDAFFDLSCEESLKRIADCGWKTLELAEVHWRELSKRDDPDREFAALSRLASSLGVTVAQTHGVTFPVCGEEAVVRDGLDRGLRSIEWCAAVGVRLYVFHPGTAPCDESEDDLKRVRDANVEVVGRLSEAARKVGMKIALENMVDAFTGGRRHFGATPAELIWLAEQTDPENVGICWDTGHGHLQRLDQGKAIRALGDRLIATHVADNDTSRDQHLLPFEGTIDWKAVLDALRDIGYEGTFNLEIGGGVHRIPISFRAAKVRYALELVTAMVNGDCFD